MDPLFLLLNPNPTISQSKELIEGVLREMRSGAATLAQIHGGGAAYVDEVLSAGDALLEQIAVADVELADVEGAQEATTQAQLDGVAYADFMAAQVRSIAPSLPAAEGKALRAAYTVGGYRLSTKRPSDLQRILEKIGAANKTHGPTLLGWGLEQADLDRCEALLMALPQAREDEQVERNEAEAAVIAREEQEVAFYKLANNLLRRVLAMQSRHPKLAQSFASVLNKYRAALSGPRLD